MDLQEGRRGLNPRKAFITNRVTEAILEPQFSGIIRHKGLNAGALRSSFNPSILSPLKFPPCSPCLLFAWNHLLLGLDDWLELRVTLKKLGANVRVVPNGLVKRQLNREA